MNPSGIYRALQLLRHPRGPIRKSDLLAFAAAVRVIETETGIESDPAHDQLVEDFGGIPRRLALIGRKVAEARESAA